MSFKKGKTKKSSSASNVRNVQSTSPPAAVVPDEAKAKLHELFSQIEHQFELMHTDNVACESMGGWVPGGSVNGTRIIT